MASAPFHQTDSPFFLPLFFNFSVPTRSVIINPFIQTLLVIPSDDVILDAKLGRPPASKESIEVMESLLIGEGSGDSDWCAVCLEEWEVGDVARVMPCDHKFHGNCIEKWLGVHGSCPVCRYEMPLEEEEEAGKKREQECCGRGGRVWVFSIDFGGILGGTGGESDSGESCEDADSSAATATEQE